MRKINAPKQIDSAKVMNTDQPATIEIDGVEVPSYYNMWMQLREIKESLKRLRIAVIVSDAAIAILALSLLLT